MTPNKLKLTTILLATTAAFAMSACSSDSGTPASTPVAGNTGGTSTGGTTTGGTGTTTDTQLTLATAPAGTTYNLSQNQGLQSYTIFNGQAYANNQELPRGAFSSGTATIVSTSGGYLITLPDAQTATFANNTNAQTVTTSGGNKFSTTMTGGGTSGLTYSTYGTWTEANSAGVPLSIGTYASGIPTTTSQMPTSGTANYQGKGFSGSVISTVNSASITGGDVLLHADFAGGTVTGSVTGITVKDALGGTFTGNMNDINLTAGRIANMGFSGAASTATNTNAPTINVPDLVANFGGRFYGPGAAEAAGSLTMTGANGTVIGVFGTVKR